jgi:hypothetical protein
VRSDDQREIVVVVSYVDVLQSCYEVSNLDLAKCLNLTGASYPSSIQVVDKGNCPTLP